MSDFEYVKTMFEKFPRKNEYGEEFYKIKKYKWGNKCIFVLTDDDCISGKLWFNKDGEFIGFRNVWRGGSRRIRCYTSNHWG